MVVRIPWRIAVRRISARMLAADWRNQMLIRRHEMTFELIQAVCLRWMQDAHEGSVDLIFGSPPYAFKERRYSGSNSSRSPHDWIDWMADVTVEAV